MILAPTLEAGQPTTRWNDESALPLNGFYDDRRDVVFSHLSVDLRLERGVCLLGHTLTISVPPIGICHWRPEDLSGEGSKAVLVRHILRGQGHGQVRPAVIGMIEGDYSLATCCPARDFDRILHGLGPRVEEGRALFMRSGRQLG